MTRPRHLLWSVAVLGILTASCGSDSGTAPVVTSIVGTWKLTSVGGKPLPYVYQASDPKLELTAKQYIITASNTFTTSYTLRGTELDGTVNTTTASDAGTVSLANNVASFVYASDGSTVTAQVTPTTFTIDGAITQVFTKQ